MIRVLNTFVKIYLDIWMINTTTILKSVKKTWRYCALLDSTLGISNVIKEKCRVIETDSAEETLTGTEHISRKLSSGLHESRRSLGTLARSSKSF